MIYLDVDVHAAVLRLFVLFTFSDPKGIHNIKTCSHTNTPTYPFKDIDIYTPGKNRARGKEGEGNKGRGGGYR